MPEAMLEQELRGLGPLVEFPATPDLATAVRRRLAAEPVRRELPWRRTLVLAFALLAVTVGGLMTVPQSRSAILEWLGIRGAEIERVPTQPTAPEQPIDLGLGDRVDLAEARERVDYPVLMPAGDELQNPDDVYVSTATPGRQVAFVYRDGGEISLLLTQFPGTLDPDFIQKTLGPGTTAENVMVGEERGYWIEGEPHEFYYLDENGQPIFETLRLAGNTLLWTRGDLTLRLEGDLTKDEALAIAESLE
jgi:hypothetical protein